MKQWREKWPGREYDMTKNHQQLELTRLTLTLPGENLKEQHTRTQSLGHKHTTLAPQSATHVSSDCWSMADLMHYFRRVCHASVSPPLSQTKSRGPWSVKREPRPSMDGQLPC